MAVNKSKNRRNAIERKRKEFASWIRVRKELTRKVVDGGHNIWIRCKDLNSRLRAS